MEQVHQHIEEYLNNRLSATEMSIFEAKSNTDAAFKAEVEKIRLFRQVAKRHATRLKIKEIQATKLAEWRSEHVVKPLVETLKEERKASFNVFRRLLSGSLAASVMLVGYLNFSQVSLPNQATISERGNNTKIDSLQKINFNNYLMAQKALQAGENDKAAQYFEKVMNGQELRPYYKDASEWFLAVANVEKNPKKSEEILKNIANKIDFKYKISMLDKAKMWAKIWVSKFNKNPSKRY